MMSGRKAASPIRSLMNVRNLQTEYAIALHEALIMPVLLYGGKTMVWRKKERSRNRTLLMDNLKTFVKY